MIDWKILILFLLSYTLQSLWCQSWIFVEILSYSVSLSDSKSALTWVKHWSELSWTRRKEKVLWPTGHSIMRTCLSPFPAQRLVASPSVAISVGIYIGPFSVVTGSTLSYGPFYFWSASWTLEGDCREGKCYYFCLLELWLPQFSSWLFILKRLYKNESKVLEYFSIIKNILATPDAFANVMKWRNHTELSDAELVW